MTTTTWIWGGCTDQRIRFNTLEGKFFDEVKVTGDPNTDAGGLGGEVRLVAADDAENQDNPRDHDTE